MEMLKFVLFLPLIVCVRCTENCGSSKDGIKLLMEEVKFLKNKLSKLEDQCVLKSDIGKIIWLIDYYLTSSKQYISLFPVQWISGQSSAANVKATQPRLRCSYVCCPNMCHYVLSSMLGYPLRFPHKKRYSVLLNPQLFVGWLMFYLCYLCLLMVSNTHWLYE